MPSLVLFGRSTCFAGDDLRFLSLAHATYRIFQLCVTISLSSFVYHTIRQDGNIIEVITDVCDGYGRFTSLTSNGVLIFHFWMVASFLLCLFSLSVLWPMYRVSGLGTPTDVTPRKPMYSICYCDMIWVNFLRVSSCTVGGLMVYNLSTYCHCMDRSEDIRAEFGLEKQVCPPQNAVILLTTILFVSQCVDAGFVVATFFWFTYHWARPPITFVSSDQKCRLCFRCCVGCTSLFTCCLFGGKDALFGDFADFSRIFANFLHDNNILDITPSDVLVGLHMVRREERHRTFVTQKRLVKERSSDHEANQTINPTKQKIILAGKSSSGRVTTTNHHVTDDNVPISSPNEQTELSTIENDANNEMKTENDRETNRVSSDLGESSSGIMNGDGDIESEDTSGLVTLQRQENKLEVLSKYNPRDVYLMSEAAHFMPIAQATYGWVSYMLEHPISGWCSLPYRILRRCSCLFPTKPRGKIAGDYLWQPHTIALTSISGCSETDLVYASYYDSATRIPYCILLDHDWKTVVVAIRGTLTLEGIFKDVSIQPKELNKMGDVYGFDGEGLYCHTGMLASSEWVYEDLTRHGKLDELLTGHYKHYRLRIIGHSLGAGVASILSVLLRPKYPQLRCLSFSPPGCVMSRELADESKTWTTSFIVGHDIVPRMSIEGFEELRDNILEMICRIKIPKYKVTQKQQKLHDKSTTDDSRMSLESILYDRDEVKDSKFRTQVLEFWELQAEIRQKNASHYIELFPPGEIIHLFKHLPPSNGGNGVLGQLSVPYPDVLSRRRNDLTVKDNPVRDGNVRNTETVEDSVEEEDERPFTARRAHRSEFRRIIVSPHLLADHDPIAVKYRFRDAAIDQFGLNHPFLEEDHGSIELEA